MLQISAMKLVVTVIGVLSLALIASCQQPAEKTAEKDLFADTDRKEILDALQTQEDCWNAADIDCFMAYYWKSDSLTFTGKSGINQGWQATYDRYINTYPDAATMGQLSFEILKLKDLAPDVVQLIGKWDLKREMGDIGGYFTLLWRKIEGKWVIVADHTS